MAKPYYETSPYRFAYLLALGHRPTGVEKIPHHTESGAIVTALRWEFDPGPALANDVMEYKSSRECAAFMAHHEMQKPVNDARNGRMAGERLLEIARGYVPTTSYSSKF